MGNIPSGLIERLKQDNVLPPSSIYNQAQLDTLNLNINKLVSLSNYIQPNINDIINLVYCIPINTIEINNISLNTILNNKYNTFVAAIVSKLNIVETNDNRFYLNWGSTSSFFKCWDLINQYRQKKNIPPIDKTSAQYIGAGVTTDDFINSDPQIQYDILITLLDDLTFNKPLESTNFNQIYLIIIPFILDLIALNKPVVPLIKIKSKSYLGYSDFSDSPNITNMKKLLSDVINYDLEKCIPTLYAANTDTSTTNRILYGTLYGTVQLDANMDLMIPFVDLLLEFYKFLASINKTLQPDSAFTPGVTNNDIYTIPPIYTVDEIIKIQNEIIPKIDNTLFPDTTSTNINPLGRKWDNIKTNDLTKILPLLINPEQASIQIYIYLARIIDLIYFPVEYQILNAVKFNQQTLPSFNIKSIQQQRYKWFFDANDESNFYSSFVLPLYQSLANFRFGGKINITNPPLTWIDPSNFIKAIQNIINSTITNTTSLIPQTYNVGGKIYTSYHKVTNAANTIGINTPELIHAMHMYELLSNLADLINNTYTTNMNKMKGINDRITTIITSKRAMSAYELSIIISMPIVITLCFVGVIVFGIKYNPKKK